MNARGAARCEHCRWWQAAIRAACFNLPEWQPRQALDPACSRFEPAQDARR